MSHTQLASPNTSPDPPSEYLPPLPAEEHKQQQQQQAQANQRNDSPAPHAFDQSALENQSHYCPSICSSATSLASIPASQYAVSQYAASDVGSEYHESSVGAPAEQGLNDYHDSTSEAPDSVFYRPPPATKRQPAKLFNDDCGAEYKSIGYIDKGCCYVIKHDQW